MATPPNDNPFDNPFAPPSATVTDIPEQTDAFELATRGSRLAAAIIDVLPYFAVGIATAIALGSLGAIRSLDRGDLTVWVVVLGVFLLIAGINVYLLARYGQTIGKRAMKIRIVRPDGRRAAFWRLLLLRILLNGIIGGLPFLRNIYWLIDSLFIFRDAQRCVHDYIADTIVVKA